VFLQEETNAGLQMVVNREGFLPGDPLDRLTETLRRAIDLSVRMRAALGAAARIEKRESEAASRLKVLEEATGTRTGGAARTSTSTTSSRDRVETLIEASKGAVASLKKTTTGSATPAPDDVRLLQATLEEATAYVQEQTDEQAQLRVLASLGTQIGTFFHEVNSLLGQARSTRDLTDELRADRTLTADQKRLARQIHEAQSALIATLERQAVYLTDTIGAESRRRRSRQRIAERVDTAVRLLGDAAARRRVAIDLDIPKDIRTPPMFSAEMNVILTNLLSNAIKAAAIRSPADGDDPPTGDRRIRISTSEDDKEVRIRMQNTGQRVDPAEGERWFRPFETTTSEVDMSLGQGLGLGLSLTRRIVEEYGGYISFQTADPRFSTAIEVRLPRR
jgi:C4-dicarboxylate-specific signal transduction histidine kinase